MAKMLSLRRVLGETFHTNPRFSSSCTSSTAHALSPCRSDLVVENNVPEAPPVIIRDMNASRKMVILNRPNALNALDMTLGAELLRLYRSWETDPKVGSIIMKGNGRAFCAGGDVVNVYNKIHEGRLDYCKEYFRTLYTLIHLIGSYSKPHVAILNGITMGGGSGISVLGRFRIATDKTAYAIPETLIGFHPDAAASYYLSRLPGHLGEYLALTADRLNGAEMLACGLATHYIRATRISLIEEKLARLENNDPLAIETLLDNYSETACIEEQSILNRMEMINECFGSDSVDGIFAALENKASGADYEWCDSTLKKLKTISPLSLKVSLRSIREGRSQTLEQCIAREYWMTVQAIHGNISKDFSEGVRTRLVDKTFAPKWDPSSLGQVSQDLVNQYFSPLSETEPPLELPIKRNRFSLSSSLSLDNHSAVEEVGKGKAMEIRSKFNKWTNPNFQQISYRPQAKL